MRYCYVLIILTIALTSCITRKEVQAHIWLNNFMGDGTSGSTVYIKDLCDRTPELNTVGFYRVLDSGKKEFISVCNPIARNMLSITRADFQKILDENLPEKPQSVGER